MHSVFSSSLFASSSAQPFYFFGASSLYLRVHTFRIFACTLLTFVTCTLLWHLRLPNIRTFTCTTLVYSKCTSFIPLHAQPLHLPMHKYCTSHIGFTFNYILAFTFFIFAALKRSTLQWSSSTDIPVSWHLCIFTCTLFASSHALSSHLRMHYLLHLRMASTDGQAPTPPYTRGSVGHH